MSFIDNASQYEGFKNSYKGIESSVILSDLIGKPYILEIIDGILSFTYNKFLGKEGVVFIKKYIHFLNNIIPQDSFYTISNGLLKLRDEFCQLGLSNYYFEEFREKNLISSLSLIDPMYLMGKIIDVGADDNRLARVLTERYNKVTHVLGTDIVCNNRVTIDDKVGFIIQNTSYKLPAADDSFDVAICRYSLHHMSFRDQRCILSEISRVLKRNGVLIVYENSFSRINRPFLTDFQWIHKKLELMNDIDINIFLSIMDIVSLGIKDKNQNFAFTFRCFEDWLTVFKSWFKIKEAKYYGLPMTDLHQVPLAVFVLENLKLN